jgi:hypothetical protein
MEHVRAQGVPKGDEVHDTGPQQHRGGGVHHPELHSRGRGGGGHSEPKPVAAEAGLMRFPPHQSWIDVAATREREESTPERLSRATSSPKSDAGLAATQCSSTHDVKQPLCQAAGVGIMRGEWRSDRRLLVQQGLV